MTCPSVELTYHYGWPNWPRSGETVSGVAVGLCGVDWWLLTILCLVKTSLFPILVRNKKAMRKRRLKVSSYSAEARQGARDIIEGGHGAPQRSNDIFLSM